MTEPGEHGQHASVIVAAAETKFGEDVGDVLLDGPIADDQSFGDAGIRPSFGHKREHVPFAGR